MDEKTLREKQEDIRSIMNNALESEGLKPDAIPSVFREEMDGKPKRTIESVGDIKEQEDFDRKRAFNKGVGGAKEGEDLPKPRDEGGFTPLR